MHWVGNYPSNELATVYKLNRARNFGDFQNALMTFKAVSQNVVYADVWDNVGIKCAAAIPIRKKGKGNDPVPGWTDEYEWRGFVNFEELPRLYNPPSGIVLSANNRSSSQVFRYHISHWYSTPYRYNRIKEMLLSRKELTIEDYLKFLADNRSSLAATMKEDIIKAVGNSDLSEDEKKALKLFTDWDGSMSADSHMAALFETYYMNLLVNLFMDEMGDDLYRKFIKSRPPATYAVYNLWKNRESSWYDDVTTRDKKEGFADIVRKSFLGAVNELGGDPEGWEWGDMHTLTLKHPIGKSRIANILVGFNEGPFETSGSWHTVCPYSYEFNSPFDVDHGASQRHAYDLSDWDNSYSVIPTGTSGIPASDHYCDQTELYVQGKFHKDLFSREAVKKGAKYTMKFKKKK
jgi:penicillin amidase